MRAVPLLLSLSITLAFAGCGPKAGEKEMPLPTMGWSSWNTYRVNISDSLIMSQADAMVSSGLADVGYNHINIDDGYFGGRDPSSGQLLIHPGRFPGGMRRVVDHIHSLGLKAGIYSDAGANTCGSYYDNDTIARGVGLFGHDAHDARFFFRDLGFDFIKVDFCGGNPPGGFERLALEPRERYTAIRKAIDDAGRPDARLNVCRWDFPGVWVRDVATSWRISHDISDRWSSVKDIIAQNLYLSAYAGGGHYNDMDMLEVGRSMSEEEDKTHFGMWCIMASPLLIGCDLTSLKPTTLALLTNPELIALDQDPLGLQAYVARHDAETYVLVKDLSERFGLERAVAFYNPGEEPSLVRLGLKDVDLGGVVEVRDVVGRFDLTPARDSLKAEVPAHGVRIFRLRAERRLERVRYEAETAWLSDYQELYNPVAFHTPMYTPVPGCSGGMAVTGLGHKPDNDLQWRDVWSFGGGEYTITLRILPLEDSALYLGVGDEPARKVEVGVPDGNWREVSIRARLKPGVNTIRLCNDRGPMPDVDYADLSR